MRLPLPGALAQVVCCASLAAQTPVFREDLKLDFFAAGIGQLGTLATGPRGTLAVSDLKTKVLYLFDSSGKRFATIGRKGGGPGEFESIATIGWTGDSLWTFDFTLLRISLFSATGKLIRTTPFATTLTSSRPLPMLPITNLALAALRPDGSVLVRGGHMALPVGDLMRSDLWYLRTRSSGEVESPIAAVPGRCPFQRIQVGDRFTDAKMAFCPEPWAGAAPDGSAVIFVVPIVAGADSGAVRVTSLDVAGRQRFVLRVPVTMEALPANVLDDDIAGRKVPEVIRAVKSFPRAQVYPPIRSLSVGHDGTAWIGLWINGNTRQEWKAVSAAGKLIGTLRIPELENPLVGDATTLWVTRELDSGEEILVRYRLQ